jgi:hypothetical protein
MRFVQRSRLMLWLHGLRRFTDRRWIRVMVKLGFLLVSAAVLGWVLFQYRDTLATYPWHIQPILVLLAIVVYYVDLLLAIWGWSRLIDRMGVRLPLREHGRIYALTLVAGRIPGAPWHIASRAAAYGQHGVSKRLVGVTSAIEMILICVSGLLCGFLVLPLLPTPQRALGWLLAVVILIGVIMLHPKTIRWLLRLVRRHNLDFRLGYRDSIIALLQYSAVWIVGGVLLFSCMQVLYPVPVFLLPSVIGIWSLSGGISTIVQFSPTGFGLRELTLSALLLLIVPPAIAVVIAIVMRVFLTATELMAALVVSQLPRFTYHNGGGLIDDTST